MAQSGSDANQPSTASSSNLEFYQCSQCHRSYSRVDHLARHVRSHLQQKPFECSICNKGFGRPDVLKRHALSHEPDANDPKRPKRHLGQSSRVAQACKSCAAAKLKCEDEKPCRRCRNKDIACEYGGEPRFSDQYQPLSEPTIPPSSSSQSQPSPGQYPHDLAHMRNTSQPSQIPTPETDTQDASEMMQRNNQPLRQHPQVPTIPEHDLSDFLREVVMPPHMDPALANPSVHHMNWSQPQQHEFWPRDVLNFTVENGPGFENLDMGMVDALSGLKGAGSYPASLVEADDMEHTRRYAAIGSEAFENSPVSRWKPKSNDNMYVGQVHLALPEGVHTRLRVDQMLLSEHLDLRARDALLALVLANCQPTHVPQIVASFPPTGLLDDLMQRFFLQHRPRIGSWIHIPSFKPSHRESELLCAVVAAGAILTGTKAMRKFGFAMHEAARLAIPRRCEEDNSITRELWVLQALMFDLDIGLWSGDQRKMELSESSQQILITMMRRGGKFQRLKTPAITPFPEDTGDVLQQKWHEWIAQESLKRIVFHAYLHVSQQSMSHLTPPIISYAELSLLLPEAQDLWTAENAEKWKNIWLSKGPARAPERYLSALDAIRDPTLLVQIQQYCDLQYSSLIVLHGVWGMIWEYTQMNAVIKPRGEHNSGALIMKSRHQDICQSLINFRVSMNEWLVEPSPEVLLIFDLLLMYLHMSLEEIQLFAGKEGKDEARRVLPLLQQWIEASNSREAMWHAAQVLRRARSFALHSLREFYAVAVYHASIAFWTFGLISKVKPLSDSGGGGGPSGVAELAAANPYVLLDGDGMTDIQRFIALGRGIPSISARPTLESAQLVSVPLNDPEAIMDSALNTLRLNHTGRMENDPMVENLVRLMQDLGRAARGLKAMNPERPMMSVPYS